MRPVDEEDIPQTHTNRAKEVLRGALGRDLATCAEAINESAALEADQEAPGGYVLVEQNKIIARWREQDHPGFAAWLMARLHERAAALRLARAQGQLSTKQSTRGRQSGKARDPEAARPALVRVIRSCLQRGEEPREYVREWLDEYGIGRTALYALIKRVETTKKS